MSTRRWRELALTLAAALGLVCVVAASGSMFLGITFLIFRSGSMAPTIPTGALGLARSVEADQLKVGDIISVVDASDVRITHRVIDVQLVGDGSASIRVRGDANDADDPAPYVITDADRLFFHVNNLGYVVAWLSNPVAVFLGGMTAGGLVVFAFGRTRTPDATGDELGREGAGHG